MAYTSFMNSIHFTHELIEGKITELILRRWFVVFLTTQSLSLAMKRSYPLLPRCTPK